MEASLQQVGYDQSQKLKQLRRQSMGEHMIMAYKKRISQVKVAGISDFDGGGFAYPNHYKVSHSLSALVAQVEAEA